MAQLFIIGTHQRTCPVAVREQLAFSSAKTRAALAALREYADEGFIISTCNRVEVGGLVAGGEAGDQALMRFLADCHHVAPEELAPHLYTFAGADAVRHVFRLAAGLDSMVLGEDQIQVQVKAALADAHEAGAAGQLIYRLLHRALAVGKRVRTETDIARSHLSVVSVALDIARDALGSLANRRVLVVGAGRMAELALKHLRGGAPQSVGIVNRTYDRAQTLAAAYGATAWRFQDLEQAVAAADLIVSCTAASEVVITADLVARALSRRARAFEPAVRPLRYAPLRQAQEPEPADEPKREGLLLLDLAVPRDIERQVAALPGVRLFDVDDMQAICEANRAARAGEVARAEALVAGEVAKFMEWWAAQEVVPTIRALRERAEAIRAAELQRTLAKLPDLSPREQEAIDALSAAIINKLLHRPITTLKDPEAGGQLAQAVQQLFHL